MAIVDVYDALISERVYKRAWTHEEAVAFIKEQNGKHFDPDIVEAFFGSRRKYKSDHEKYSHQ